MIRENVLNIINNIDNLKSKLGIKYSVNLMAVTKTRSIKEIEEVIDAGLILLGENRIQEAHKKYTDARLTNRKIDLHIIGHLQRNKIKKAMVISSFVESIDKIETLYKLDSVCKEMDKKADYLIEVNTSGEEQKNGVAPSDLEKFIIEIQNKNFSNINLRGLMTVGPLTSEEKTIRKSFRLLNNLFLKKKDILNKKDFDILSMGMSSDYMLAIEEGSNLVRVGTGIFGRRNY